MMRSCSRVIVLLLSWWITLTAQAQWLPPLFYPSVQVETKEDHWLLPSQKEQLQSYLDAYLKRIMPPTPLQFYPRYPITLTLKIHITEEVASHYLADLDIVIYRPIYGEQQKKPILQVEEKGIPFRLTDLLKAPPFTPIRSLPEETLQGHLYYYALLALISYYDSFALYGGEEQLQALLRLQPRLEALWEAGSLYNRDIITLRNRLTPQLLFPELRDTSFKSFRNIWYLYHRQALDSQDERKYEAVLEQIMAQLLDLWGKDPTKYFFSFFGQIKGAEIYNYLERNPYSNRKIRQIMEIIYPQYMK